MSYSKYFKNNKGDYIDSWSLEKDGYHFQCTYNHKTNFVSVDCPSVGKPPKTAIAKPHEREIMANLLAAEIIEYDQ